MTGLQDAGPLRILIAPSRYVQGPGALSLLAGQLEVLGIKKPMAMGGPTAIKTTKEFIESGLSDKGLKPAHWVTFNRECTWDEIARMAEECKSNECDAILSIGGGKSIDTGKAAATDVAIDIGKVPAERLEHFGAGVPKIVVPTIAATDAPCSALTVVYTPEHVYVTFLVYPTNPTMVCVDSAIIAKAPARFLVSGMGDALATWFEADMCYRTNGVNMPGGSPPMTALAIARLCFETLMRYGVQAKLACSRGAVTPALEKIIEANTLLSGLGFESGGLSAAHGIHNGFTVVEDKMKDLPGPPKHRPYHGELVAFGALSEMVLEDRDSEFIRSVMRFCKTVGLPTCLRELGLAALADNDIEKVAQACAGDVLLSTMNRAFPEPVDGKFYPWEAIRDAIKAVDAMGEAYPDISHPEYTGRNALSTPGSY
jgi:glycerol dehydrogenase